MAALVEQAAVVSYLQQGKREQPLASILAMRSEIGLHPGHRGSFGIEFSTQVADRN